MQRRLLPRYANVRKTARWGPTSHVVLNKFSIGRTGRPNDPTRKMSPHTGTSIGAFVPLVTETSIPSQNFAHGLYLLTVAGRVLLSDLYPDT